MGNALIPVQLKEGCPGGFAAAVNASSSTVSVLIPPSIPLILYGLVSNTSIIDLFVAGILPGPMLALGMFAAVWWVAGRHNLPTAPLAGGFRGYRRQVVSALPALLMPVFVIGTLRFGIATPTEVSVLAAACGSSSAGCSTATSRRAGSGRRTTRLARWRGGQTSQ